MLSRRLARPMLAAAFVANGADALRNPASHTEGVASLASYAERANLPKDPEQLVRINAGIQLGAGLLLASNRLPRLAAAVLAASLVPTTLAQHRFWEEQDAEARAQHQQQFVKSVGLLGGLVLAARDLEGAPSLLWRARRVASRTRTAATVAAESARKAVPVG